MSLIDAIKAVESRVQNYRAAASGVEESSILQQRLRDLLEVSGPLAERVARVTLFRAQGIDVPPPPPVVDQAYKRVENVKKRFRESRDARSLTQGRDWAYLKRYIGETEKGIDEALATTWQNLIQGAFTGEPPNDLERTLAPTDTNKKALTSYRQEWQALRELARRVPVSEEEFFTAKEVASRLREIHGRFERDVPEEVKTFLEAVGREGAGLTLLTEGVRQWLEENQSIDHYRIIAK